MKNIIARFLVLMIAVSAFFTGCQPREPMSQGKPLSYWLDCIYQPSDSKPKKPGLARADENGRIVGGDQNFQHLQQRQAERIAGEKAIKEMGARAVPALRKMLNDWKQTDDDSHCRAVLSALSFLGTNSKPALTTVLPLATNQNREIKIRALSALTACVPTPNTCYRFCLNSFKH